MARGLRINLRMEDDSIELDTIMNGDDRFRPRSQFTSLSSVQQAQQDYTATGEYSPIPELLLFDMDGRRTNSH